MNRKPITASQIKQKMRDAIAREQESIDAFTGDRNPQTVTMLTEAKARQEAWQAVLEALEGNPFLLNTFTRSL